MFIVIVFFPLITLAGLLIYLEDGGPIFYSQLRTGQFNTIIRIYKLRTMKINAETSVAKWAEKRSEDNQNRSFFEETKNR